MVKGCRRGAVAEVELTGLLGRVVAFVHALEETRMLESSRAASSRIGKQSTQGRHAGPWTRKEQKESGICEENAL